MEVTDTCTDGYACEPQSGLEAWSAYCETSTNTQGGCAKQPAATYCQWVCSDPTPTPPDPTPVPPTPTPAGDLPFPMYGYYSWNWGSGSTGPSDANVGIAFTGYTDVTQAVSGYPTDASWCCPSLVTPKLITLGGGNAAGTFTAASLTSIEANLSQITAAGYSGVVFDVEEVTGSSSVMVPAFASAFAACQAAGLSVVITTSHSAPYQTNTPATATALVTAWVQDTNVDVISPQLYSSGYETSPDFAETNSCVN